MKHLDEYKIFENKMGDFIRDSRINSICKKYDIKKYTINDDGSIDVDGDVDFFEKNITKIPLKFNKVSGFFNCSDNKLTSLEGCPKYVGNNFGCSKNKLTSLEGGPEYIGGSFFCSNNFLKSLEGCTKYVKYLDCSNNKLTSLEGFPEHIKQKMFTIGSKCYCVGNPVYSIVRYFINMEDREISNLIEIFNYYDIVQDMNVIYDRLVFFYEGIDVKVTDSMLKEIEKNGYKIIR